MAYNAGRVRAFRSPAALLRADTPLRPVFLIIITVVFSQLLVSIWM